MESRVCSNCGMLVLPGDKFCLRCGKPVKMTAPSEAVSYPENNQPVSPDYNADEQSLTAPSGRQTGSWDTGINFDNFYNEQPGQEHPADSGQTFVQPSAEQQNTGYPEQPLINKEYPSGYMQQPAYPGLQPNDQQPVYPDQQLYNQQPVYPDQQLYNQQTYPNQQGYDQQLYGQQPVNLNQQPVQPDISSVQPEIFNPEPQQAFGSSGEEVMQDGFRRFLTSDQESWNRWVQSNMASTENLEGGGRKEKRTKIWPFGR